MNFRDRLRQILISKESPHKTAIAFSIGVFLGMSPLIGFHTLLGLAIAWIFNLNKVVTLTGVFVTNPWTIVPIYTFGTWIGAKVIGIDNIILHIDWSNITLLSFFWNLGSLILPFIVGTTLVGVISAILSYFMIYNAVRSNRE